MSSITLKEVSLRIALKIPFLKKTLQNKVLSLIQKKNSRERVNAIYNNLNYYEKAVFHTLFARLFRDNPEELENGSWEIKFLNEKIKLPLKGETGWLDWDTASAITGHDVDVKITYETLLQSQFKPRVFFDVGANYGTHSLLFLSQNVETVSFEPNPNCQQVFRNFCRLNNYTEKLQDVAVSNNAGEMEFWFPERDTWLGTMVADYAENLAEHYKLEKIKVPVITLDDYVEKTGLNPDLIKIDTEGNELNVLEGALQTLKNAKPLVIFESNITTDAEERRKIYEFFEKSNYQIAPLPLLSDMKLEYITLNQLQAIVAGNFLAVHNMHNLVKA